MDPPDPPPLINICSMAYLHVKNMPRPSMDMTSSQSAGVASTTDASGMMPAFDGDIQPAILLNCRGDHLAHVFLLRDVGGDHDDVIGHIPKRILQC